MKYMPVSQVILRDLRDVLEESNCISSPECLKHSIMKAKFVKHFTQELLDSGGANLQPEDKAGHAAFLAAHYFDQAVDTIYSSNR